MFTLSHLFISPAFAQDASSGTGGLDLSQFINLWPFAAIFIVFYFLIIRPQQRKAEEHTRMLKALQRGDRVITNSGLYGKIVKIDGEEAVTLEVADGVNLKFAKGYVASLVAKTEPASSEGEQSGKK